MKIEIKTYQREIMNKSITRTGLNVIKNHGAGFSTAILPPGYEGEVPEGYLVFRPYSNAVHMALRPVAEPGTTMEGRVAYAKTQKVYRLSEASNPPETH